MTLCPDFDLADFTAYDPAILHRDGDDPAGAFVLSLALAYNDLKSLQWMVQQLARGRPDDPTAVNPYNGQFHGMQVYISRMTVGLVQEVLKAVETAATNGVLENQDFKDACLAAKKAFPSVRTKWDGLVKLSKGEHAELEGLSKFLIKVRNNVAYHSIRPICGTCVCSSRDSRIVARCATDCRRREFVTHCVTNRPVQATQEICARNSPGLTTDCSWAWKTLGLAPGT